MENNFSSSNITFVNPDAETQAKDLLHDFSPGGETFFNRQKTGILFIAGMIILAGILTGYKLAQKNQGLPAVSESGKPKFVKSQKIIGSTSREFKDSAEGVIEKGGIDGEGTHKLQRSGGESQTAYLTSSVLDLDQFVGKKVRVWGETNKAQKAGWLMDVGRVELYD